MQEDKFGKVIKEIRKKYHLTQKDLADKYHVTYQAVSKWENGKNLPDISLMKEISKDYNISLEDMIDGNITKKKNVILPISLVASFIIVIALIIIIVKNNNNFESKTISSLCEDYKISGVISYNESKSTIYIPKIEYCGEKLEDKYKEISCTLYEKKNSIIKEIDTFSYNDNKEITISEFMNLVSFNVDNYFKICKSFSDSLFLDIKAVGNDNKMFFHTIALTVDDKCN